MLYTCNVTVLFVYYSCATNFWLCFIWQPYTLEVYKSLQDKLSLLDSAIKMHDGNAITAVSIIGTNLGFWKTAHLPLPWANILP